jgi:hypothetical protein
MKVSGRLGCPTGSGQVRLWAGICALLVAALRRGVGAGVPERRLDTAADQPVVVTRAEYAPWRRSGDAFVTWITDGRGVDDAGVSAVPARADRDLQAGPRLLR